MTSFALYMLHFRWLHDIINHVSHEYFVNIIYLFVKSTIIIHVICGIDMYCVIKKQNKILSLKL